MYTWSPEEKRFRFRKDTLDAPTCNGRLLLPNNGDYDKVLLWRTIAATECSAGTRPIPWQPGSCSPRMLLTSAQGPGALSKGNCCWPCCWGKTTSSARGFIALPPSTIPAINMQHISSVAGGYIGLEVLSFNFLILQALCLFKLDGFHFYPFLCPPIKHFNPSNVKCWRCATAGNTDQGKSGVGLKW